MAIGDIITLNNFRYKDMTPVMTFINTPTPYIEKTSFMQNVNGTHLFQLFDENLDTYYQVGINEKIGTFQIYLGKATEIDSYAIMPHGEKIIKSWKLQGSNDNVSWNDIHSITNKTDWVDSEYSVFNIGGKANYSYYRFDITDAITSFELTEIKFLSSIKPEIEIHKTLESNLPNTVSDGNEHIYFTEKGNIYMTKNDGTLQQMGGGTGGTNNYNSLENLPSINGKTIKGNVTGSDLNLATYSDVLDKVTYASGINNGNVKISDRALMLEGVELAQPEQYYGKNILGEIGYHYFPVSPTSVTHEVEQRIIKNAISNNVYIIDSTEDLSEAKLYIQCYKKVEGNKDVQGVINTFTKGNKIYYYYDEDGLELDENFVYHKQEHIISSSNTTNSDGFYDINIDLTKLIDILNIESKVIK